MRFERTRTLCVLAALATIASPMSAQELDLPSVMPRLVPYTGGSVDHSGQQLNGALLMTFALYENPVGGAPLWVEIQTVEPDDLERFTVLLGAGSPTGLPLELFASGAARWLGVQLPSNPEQPRTMFASVPYALKAADAETVGGLSGSSFLAATRGSSLNGGADAALTAAPAADADGSGIDEETARNLVSVANDQVIADELIVTGSACIGSSCANGESFGCETIRLK